MPGASRRRAAWRAALRRAGRRHLHRRVQAALAVGGLDPRRQRRRGRWRAPTPRAGRGRAVGADRRAVLRRQPGRPAAGARRGATSRCCARTSSSIATRSCEARAAGADAVLLIVAALDDASSRALLADGARRWAWRCWSRSTTRRGGRARWRAGRRRSSASTTATCGRSPSIATWRVRLAPEHPRRPRRRRRIGHPRRRRRRAAARRRRRRDAGRRDADARARIPGPRWPRCWRPVADTAAFLVKICGVTTAEDAPPVAAAGAGAIGVNLWPGSKRFVGGRSAAARRAGRRPARRAAGRRVRQRAARRGRARGGRAGAGSRAASRRRAARRLFDASRARTPDPRRARARRGVVRRRGRLGAGAVAVRRVRRRVRRRRRPGALAADRRRVRGGRSCWRAA